MAHSREEQESGLRRKGRDIAVAASVAIVLIAAWLWHSWSRGVIPVDALIGGTLFLASVLVGLRCLDLVLRALTAHYRFRDRLAHFDGKAAGLHRRLDKLEGR